MEDIPNIEEKRIKYINLGYNIIFIQITLNNINIKNTPTTTTAPRHATRI